MKREFLSVCLIAIAVALFLAPSASATVIDFNALPAGNNPNPLILPGATFTTAGGFNYIINGFGSNELCPSISSSSSANCSRDLEVLFDAASSAISFAFAGNNDTTIGNDIGDVQLFSGATLLGTVNVIVTDGSSNSYDLVSLAGFSSVTRLLISSTDVGGVVYDDFTFTPSGATVPEPSTLVLLSAGLGGLLLAGRRRRVRQV